MQYGSGFLELHQWLRLEAERRNGLPPEGAPVQGHEPPLADVLSPAVQAGGYYPGNHGTLGLHGGRGAGDTRHPGEDGH